MNVSITNTINAMLNDWTAFELLAAIEASSPDDATIPCEQTLAQHRLWEPR
jgi:hypothetical protein